MASSAALALADYLSESRRPHERDYWSSGEGSILLQAYTSAASVLYEGGAGDKAFEVLCEVMRICSGDIELLHMVGEGPLKSWLSKGEAEPLTRAVVAAQTSMEWRVALEAVTLQFRRSVEPELRSIEGFVLAVIDLPPQGERRRRKREG